MRALASMIGCLLGILATLAGCVEPPQRPATFGVRVVPDGSGWAVRWMGPGPVVIDGTPRRRSPISLPDDEPHVVAGQRIPPRVTATTGAVRFVVLASRMRRRGPILF